MSTQLTVIKKGNTQLVFDKPGKYVVFFSNVSGTISCRIVEKGVELHLIGLYDMKGKDRCTIRTEQIHVSPDSFSNLSLTSVVKDSASLAFSGLIRIEKNAQKTHANQKNQNIILSKEASVSFVPTLEICADDVHCTHGSSSGPLPENQMRYLQMRGLNRSEAEAMWIDGFKNQVYEKLRNLGVNVYD